MYISIYVYLSNYVLYYIVCYSIYQCSKSKEICDLFNLTESTSPFVSYPILCLSIAVEVIRFLLLLLLLDRYL